MYYMSSFWRGIRFSGQKCQNPEPGGQKQGKTSAAFWRHIIAFHHVSIYVLSFLICSYHFRHLVPYFRICSWLFLQIPYCSKVFLRFRDESRSSFNSCEFDSREKNRNFGQNSVPWRLIGTRIGGMFFPTSLPEVSKSLRIRKTSGKPIA